MSQRDPLFFRSCENFTQIIQNRDSLVRDHLQIDLVTSIKVKPTSTCQAYTVSPLAPSYVANFY